MKEKLVLKPSFWFMRKIWWLFFAIWSLEQQNSYKGEEETDDVLDLGVTDGLDDLEADEENVGKIGENARNQCESEAGHADLRHKLQQQRSARSIDGAQEDDEPEEERERRGRFQSERTIITGKIHSEIPDSLESVVTNEQPRTPFSGRGRGRGRGMRAANRARFQHQAPARSVLTICFYNNNNNNNAHLFIYLFTDSTLQEDPLQTSRYRTVRQWWSTTRISLQTRCIHQTNGWEWETRLLRTTRCSNLLKTEQFNWEAPLITTWKANPLRWWTSTDHHRDLRRCRHGCRLDPGALGLTPPRTRGLRSWARRCTRSPTRWCPNKTCPCTWTTGPWWARLWWGPRDPLDPCLMLTTDHRLLLIRNLWNADSLQNTLKGCRSVKRHLLLFHRKISLHLRHSLLHCHLLVDTRFSSIHIFEAIHRRRVSHSKIKIDLNIGNWKKCIWNLKITNKYWKKWMWNSGF